MECTKRQTNTNAKKNKKNSVGWGGEPWDNPSRDFIYISLETHIWVLENQYMFLQPSQWNRDTFYCHILVHSSRWFALTLNIRFIFSRSYHGFRTGMTLKNTQLFTKEISTWTRHASINVYALLFVDFQGRIRRRFYLITRHRLSSQLQLSGSHAVRLGSSALKI